MPYDAIVAQLDAYRSLEPDWDSHGAEPFSAVHLAHAARIAHLLADYVALMHVVPYNGGIQIELKSDGRWAELDILADGTVYALAGTDDPLTFVDDDDDGEEKPCTDAELLRLAAWVRSARR